MEVDLTQERLQSLFRYNELSGEFTRLSDNKIINIKDERGYIRIRVGKKRYRAHRLAFLYMTGGMPLGVDHINGTGSDNRWNNLRECTQAQNCRNRGIGHSSTSGIKNVCWREETKRWQVVIVENGKSYYYGEYYDVYTAELVAIGARVKHHGEFARV